MGNREIISEELVRVISEMGYPEEFGYLIASELRTENYMLRMINYLRNARPQSAEEIADEMITMTEERDRWVDKKKNEYYNCKLNSMLYNGLFDESETDEG